MSEVISMASIRAYTCPYFREETASGNIICEVGEIRFPDKIARRGYVYCLCAANPEWKNCSIAKMLTEFYEREEQKNGKQTEKA